MRKGTLLLLRSHFSSGRGNPMHTAARLAERKAPTFRGNRCWPRLNGAGMHHPLSSIPCGNGCQTDPETEMAGRTCFTDLASEGWVVPDPPSTIGFTAERNRSVGLDVRITTTVPSPLTTENTRCGASNTPATGNTVHIPRHPLRCCRQLPCSRRRERSNRYKQQPAPCFIPGKEGSFHQAGSRWHSPGRNPPKPSEET